MTGRAPGPRTDRQVPAQESAPEPPEPPEPPAADPSVAGPGPELSATGPAAPERGYRAQPSPLLQAGKAVGTVVAPLSLLTALMYYFGVLHAFWFFGHFGVDYTVFRLSTQDYLLRSADGLFVPLTVLAAVSLAAMWGYRLLPTGLTAGRRRAAVRLVVPAVMVVGLGLVLVAVVGVVDPLLLADHLALPGLALAAGVLLLLAASRTAHWLTGERGAPHGRTVPQPVAAAEWAAVLVLVSVGLFWAAGDWSAAVGTRRGNQVAGSLAGWPDAVVYTSGGLGLAVPGVREVTCTGTEPPVVRYDGLKLVVQAGDQYLFLPGGWRPGDGTAVVIPAGEVRRLEFTAPGVSRGGGC